MADLEITFEPVFIAVSTIGCEAPVVFQCLPVSAIFTFSRPPTATCVPVAAFTAVGVLNGSKSEESIHTPRTSIPLTLARPQYCYRFCTCSDTHSSSLELEHEQEDQVHSDWHFESRPVVSQRLYHPTHIPLLTVCSVCATAIVRVVIGAQFFSPDNEDFTWSVLSNFQAYSAVQGRAQFLLTAL